MALGQGKEFFEIGLARAVAGGEQVELEPVVAMEQGAYLIEGGVANSGHRGFRDATHVEADAQGVLTHSDSPLT
jgi:hypothetical protein